MQYSISNWIYATEDLEKSLQRLAKYEYDAVELEGEPDNEKYEPKKVKTILKKYGLEVSSIAGMYLWKEGIKRDLASSDKKIREQTVEYLFRCIDYARLIGAKLVIVVPAAVSKLAPSLSKKEDWKNSVKAVQEVAKYAEKKDILLAIEPINRYETYLVNSVQDALYYAREVNSSHVKIMADTFHMNIEERDIPEAIRIAGSNLINVHIADSNRCSVGRGHINFKALIKALKEINYQYALTLEPLPPVSDPYLVIGGGVSENIFDQYAAESIMGLKYFERIT
ncbi:MAG TPA: sugar phosphate isomerase/epimerase family protein [Desulfatiglandales bacterium]|nr:sugar phosphate isomerase/epimerase family protein [Desulfatiglandales bacterium]